MRILFTGVIVFCLSSSAWADAFVPYQLHPRRFAACLKQAIPSADVATTMAIGKATGFNNFDLLLVHLAVYPGVQIPGISSVLQPKAKLWWTDWYNRRERTLADAVIDYGAHSKTLVPRDLFNDALKSCGKGDFFCASLIAHNVLRTLGRHPQGIHRSLFTSKTTDYNPAWFQAERDKWVDAGPSTQKSFIALRADGGGDRWGEWYHFYGILTYALHEVGMGKRPASVEFVVRMNELLNPLLAGGKEEPEKARLDRDSIEVAQWFLTDKAPPKVDCTKAATYVAGTWSDDPEPFPLED
jgi:hypothetical protein